MLDEWVGMGESCRCVVCMLAARFVSAAVGDGEDGLSCFEEVAGMLGCGGSIASIWKARYGIVEPGTKKHLDVCL